MSYAIGSIAKAAACPRRLAATLDHAEPRVRSQGGRSRRENSTQDSFEEALLGRIFEQIIQHLVVNSADLQQDLKTIQGIFDPRHLQNENPIKSLNFPFSLSDFTLIELEFRFSRKTLIRLGKDVRRFVDWFSNIEGNFSWFPEVTIRGHRRSDTLDSTYSLHGRIDLLGLCDDRVLLIEIKRTKVLKKDAFLQAGLYRDLLLQPDSEVYHETNAGQKIPIILPDVDPVAYVYHASQEAIAAWSTEQIDERILNGREPDPHAIPDINVCGKCPLGSQCEARILHGRRLS